METVERYKRQDPGHPNRELVDNWKEQTRLQQKSLLAKAQQEEKSHHLPQDRELETKCPYPPPWFQLQQPVINTKLHDPTVNKQTHANTLKLCALETIDSYTSPAIRVYTDGSAYKSTSSAGYGFRAKYPDGSTQIDCGACGMHCSNYEAELMAIQYAVRALHQQFELGEKEKHNIVIFSDSSSALEALQHLPYKSKLLSSTAIDIHNLISAHSIQITLQWIPGHTDIHGNDIADRLAKEGAAKPQNSSPCNMNTARQLLKSQYNDIWLKRWENGTTGRRYFAERNRPQPKDDLNGLCRRSQSLIFQFRTGHAPVNYHLNRIKPGHEPMCRHCHYPYETVDHILFDCPQLQHLRKLLPPEPNVKNTLCGPLDQLFRTSSFIRLVMTVKSEKLISWGS